jgi:hypothetical protein
VHNKPCAVGVNTLPCAWTAADRSNACALQKTLDVFGTAAAIHNKFSKNPGQEAYGVALIPKKGGYVVAAVSGW